MEWKENKNKQHKDGIHKPSMTRRCTAHDYKSRCFYMITLVVNKRHPLLGTIEGDGLTTQAQIKLGVLGQAVTKELVAIPNFYPQLEIGRLQIMPDHLHVIIFVKEPIPVHLGRIINGFKVACNKAFRALKEQGKVRSDSTALWEQGYHDRILRHEGQLQRMRNYIADNPRRWAIKRNNPELFRVRHNVEAGGQLFAAQGNVFLLDAPWLVAVKCSRSLSQDEIARECERYLSLAREGAVLVSPSISAGEKAVMRAAFDQGFPLIFLQENGFAPLAKPGGRRFDACAQGRLLVLAPWEYHTDRRTIRRDQCLSLNEMAEAICSENRGTATMQKP
ncbi:MAG: transposase [Muribaculaceae bacterium]|nr:transposase [Muribaculaceae bacterium]